MISLFHSATVLVGAALRKVLAACKTRPHLRGATGLPRWKVTRARPLCALLGLQVARTGPECSFENTTQPQVQSSSLGRPLLKAPDSKLSIQILV